MTRTVSCCQLIEYNSVSYYLVTEPCVRLRQRGLCLNKPMRQLQSLSYKSLQCLVSSQLELLSSFLYSRWFSAAVNSFTSAAFRATFLLMIIRHIVPLDSKPSHAILSQVCMPLIPASLCSRSWWFSSTMPAHRIVCLVRWIILHTVDNLRFLRGVYKFDTGHHRRDLTAPIIRRVLIGWNVLTLYPTLAHSVHASLPWINVAYW